MARLSQRNACVANAKGSIAQKASLGKFKKKEVFHKIVNISEEISHRASLKIVMDRNGFRAFCSQRYVFNA